MIQAATAAELDGGAALVLNGAGVRTRFFFRVYVGVLYLAKKTPAVNAVISDAGAKRIALHMLRIWLGENPADSDLKKGMLGG